MQDEPNDAGTDCLPITLTLEQRDAIYRVLVAETYSLTDLDLEGLSRDSFERLRDTIRFLEEIGPGPLDPRESFEVTMPPGGPTRGSRSSASACTLRGGSLSTAKRGSTP